MRPDMPKSLKKAAERAIRFEDDKIQRLEYQVRCLEKENERHQRENMINLRENEQLRVQRYNLNQSIRRLGEQKQQLQYSNVQKNRQLDKLITEHWRCLEKQKEMEAIWTSCHLGIQKVISESNEMMTILQNFQNENERHRSEMAELTNELRNVSQNISK